MNSVDNKEIEAQETAGQVETAVATAQTTARQSLVDWANGQDGWLRMLVDAILTAPAEVSESTLQRIFDRYLAEKDLSDESVDPFESLASGESTAAEKAPLSIDELSAVVGVNALVPDQKIAFNPNLTVVFGENGSGKTGYTRILKTIADVRTIEEILGNVNEATPQSAPKCTIRYTADGVAKDLEWSGETGVVPFTAISIFDSPAVALHVDDDLSYLYTPSDLALFPMVGNGVERVQNRLTAAIEARKPKGNPFLPHFERGTAAYTVIETLGPATELEALSELATTKEEVAKQLDGLNATVEALRGGAVSAQIAVARSRRDLYAKLTMIAKAVEGFDIKAYRAAMKSAAEAEASSRELRDQLAEVGGTGEEPAERWQEFILSGESYREHAAAHGEAPDEETCIYCRQPLDSGARALIERYREFANGAVRERLKAAQEQISVLGATISGLDLSSAQGALAAVREEQPDDPALVKAGEFLTGLQGAAVAIDTGQEVAWESIAEDAEPVRLDSEAQEATATQLISTLKAKEDDRAAKLKEAEVGRRDLTDRIELGSRLEAITQHVEAAKWSYRAEELAKRFRGVSRSLTETVKTASSAVLNSDFERRFKEECEALRAPKVGLAFPGRRGEAARRKTVSADHKPSKVLSEGEQKVIALADFLAEASLRKVPAPLIFDDPVSSLDYRRIGEVSKRIAELATERQVIVFTHNVWLAVELLSRFEDNRDACTYYRVSDEGGKGTIVEGVHPRWDTVKKTKGKINAAIQTAGSLEGEEREVFVERAYSLMRTWCEVVVEDELFAGVLGRFAPNVSMGRLANVRPDRLQAAISAIVPIFEKACRVMEGHSQPLESLGVSPSLDEAKADWAALQAARDAYKA